MKRFLLSLLPLTAALCAPVLAQSPDATARPFLDPLFTDHMVLQRGQPDPVWGWTTPGTTVTVTIAGKHAAATAGADGAWTATLPPLPTGGPYMLSVTGPQSVQLSDVLVGDVWLCSGQSNMQFGIGNTQNAPAEIAAANYPQIRLFMVPNTTALSPRAVLPLGNNDPAERRWRACTPQTVAQGGWNGFTAVGYFFGRDLYQDLHVPIGLIESNVGGTPAEAWTSEEALRAHMPVFRPQLAQLDAERQQTTPLTARLMAWYQQNDPGSASGLGWADPALDDTDWPTMTLPGFFQQAGIPELANINGIVWFRRTFDLPAGAAGQPLTLHFYADDNDTTWVNGVQVGATEGFNTPRAYIIPASALKPTGNVIAVRVLDTGGVGGIWGDTNSLYLQSPGGQPVSLAGSWHVHLGKALTQMPPAPQSIEGNTNFPTVLYNAMIRPLIPFGIKGTIWYQGENNAGSVASGIQYQTLLPTMITDWRGRWEEGNFPFLIVQLAGFGQPPAQPGDDGWAELRQAQWLTAHTLPNAGIATAVDIGNPTNIHPTDKQDVGKRLALVAEAKVYHQKVHYSGPVYQSMQVQGNTVRLSFRHLGGGLVAQGGGPLTGFAIAGADQKWAWADARIVGNNVVVSSPQVPHPAAVRYAWASYMANNLANKAGLPAFPFRTDDWTSR